jgi:outer membrane murein-binding lipoprotein Lpp
MMNRVTGMLLGALCVALTPAMGWAQEKKADDLKADVLALSKRIDAFINKALKEAETPAAAKATDYAYFRRLNLDLAGRIPELNDIHDFIDDTRSEKRWIWVERLLGNDISEDPKERENYLKEYGDLYAKHFANVWRAHMIVNSNNNFQAINLTPQFESWLHDKLKANTSYDKMVQEILMGSQNGVMQPQFGGRGFQQNLPASTAAFYFANENKPENLAGTTARLFLGVKLECAQCHPHPFAKWTKNQFWEFAAFFSGVNPQQFRQPNQKVVLANNGRQIQIPGGKEIAKAKFLNGKEPIWKDGADSRKVLADWITAKDNPFFAKATVDMVWQYFFGVSLLEPIIEPSSDSPITHPELLEELAKEFVAHNYDLKFLIRAIVHTDAYQRSSEPVGKGTADDLLLFARMPVRGMSPEQFFDSLLKATDYVPAQTVNMNRGFPFNQQQGPRGEFLSKFASQDRRNETQTSILQALFMMNGKFLEARTKFYPNLTMERIAELTDARAGKNVVVEENLSLHNLALQPTTTAKKVRSLYMLVLSRPPRAEETERMVRYIDGGGANGDARRAVADVYWALLNSGEFMLNH